MEKVLIKTDSILSRISLHFLGWSLAATIYYIIFYSVIKAAIIVGIL